MALICFSIFLLFTFPLASSSAKDQHPNYRFSFSKSDFPWRPSQNLTLLSRNSTFAAGFLPTTPPNSSNLFIFSIYYHKINLTPPTIVWVANPTSPVKSSDSLEVTSAGELYLNSSSGKNLWPHPERSGGATVNKTELLLNETGNLEFGSWESFDFPTDTILPTQTINGTELVSQNGKFRFNGSSLTFNGSDSYWTSQTFVLLGTDGRIILQGGGNPIFSADTGEKRLRRLTLANDGNLRAYSFDREKSQWVVVWRAVQEICRVHGLCGPNAICMEVYGSDTDTYCVCPPGYKRSPGSGSCERKTPIENLGKTRFIRLDYVNFTGQVVDQVANANYTVCESKCLADPKCLGFVFKYDGTLYCSLQIGSELLNGFWSPGTQAAMFLRVDISETDQTNFTGMTSLLQTTCPTKISLPYPPEERNTTTRHVAILSTLFTLELLLGVLSFWAFVKKYIKYRDMARTLGLELLPMGGPKRFSYSEIKAATRDFSNNNMIGRGGFSDVYRGELRDGRIVAIKCLKNITGGDAEFWAEVTIIGRMHHLNLVRLWGFCNEKGKRILVYEHVSNGSLDKFLFEPGHLQASTDEPQEDNEGTGAKGQGVMIPPKPMLDWSIRYRIALGVARAIAYLHEECLEWVLHCDIKPENILLGDDFCPKVADFGLSKLRKKEQVVSMSRIRGTRGYLAPEWVKSEPISSKADVYSFGMVLLEMVTGVRNFVMREQMESSEWYLPRWAFDKVFKQMKVEDILDHRIKDSFDHRLHFKLVDRMVKTAMWCIQEKAELRPSMGKVAKMLEGTVEIIGPPKPTIFYLADEDE